MSPDPADLALLNYLEGEPDVVRRAAVVCNAAARFKRAQDTLTGATAAFTAALADAGVKEDDQPQISCAFIYLHHRACHTPHGAGIAEEGGHHDR